MALVSDWEVVVAFLIIQGCGRFALLFLAFSSDRRRYICRGRVAACVSFRCRRSSFSDASLRRSLTAPTTVALNSGSQKQLLPPRQESMRIVPKLGIRLALGHLR